MFKVILSQETFRCGTNLSVDRYPGKGSADLSRLSNKNRSDQGPPEKDFADHGISEFFVHGRDEVVEEASLVGDSKPERFAILREVLTRTRGVANPLLVPVVVASAYALGSLLGFYLTPKDSPIATYWPPNAILMASFLLTKPRRWWTIVIGVLAAHLIVQSHTGIPIATSFGWFASNIGEALVGAVLVRQFNKSGPIFGSVRATQVFLVFGVLVAPMVTSFLDAGIVVVTHWGKHFWMLWTARLFSNMLAALTFSPAIIALATSRFSWRKIRVARVLEATLLCLLLVGITISVYGRPHVMPGLVPVLLYAPLPLLLWSSLRFGAGGLSGSVALMAVFSFHYVSDGGGPFASPSLAENVLFLQILLIVVTVPMLLLDAVIAEHQRTESLLRESGSRTVGTQERERRRIASELHDDIGQRLSLVQLELSRLSKLTGVASRMDLKSSVMKVIEQLGEISEATRDLSHGLHPFHLEYLGLTPALRSFCEEIQESAPLEIDLEEGESPGTLDSDTSLCLFRVAQEALHNVVKHSQAKRARVELGVKDRQVVLRIIDDGVGFVPGRGMAGCLGLINMSERLRSIGGTMKVTSAPAKGTIVEASVPRSRHANSDLGLAATI